MIAIIDYGVGNLFSLKSSLAMIGAQAYYEYLAGNTADMSLNAYATKSILGEAL